MKFMLTKKDVIALNEYFSDGSFHSEPSLDFAIGYAKKTENWIKALAFLVRAILLDHVFVEGNKRTVALLVKTYVEFEGYDVYDDRLLLMIKRIIFKNIITVSHIEELIKNVIRK